MQIQKNSCSDENTKCSQLSQIEEINVAGNSNDVNEVAIESNILLSEKDSDSEDLQTSDEEVDDTLSYLSYTENDSSSCTDNLLEYEIDLASDMDEYEEIPTADEDDNNVIDHNQDPPMEQVMYICITLQSITDN